ncbi:MAG TPA: DUF2085 domain-containing protein [Xenococcaceae cyanobacterium]|jgi:uncharacterized membrane protein
MLKNSAANSFAFKQSINWQRLLLDLILVALLSGPLAAPFLASWGIFPVGIIAKIIYFMGGHVCPQSEMGLMVSPPHLMAVCMRCYGVLLALITTRLLYAANQGQKFYWLDQYRFLGSAIASILTFAYPLEMIAQSFNLWGYNNIVVTIFGYLTGLGIGLFLIPVLYRQKRRYTNMG